MRSIVALGLCCALWAAPAAAQPAPATEAPEPPGTVEAPPVLIPSATMALRRDLLILQAALEGYRAGHFWSYPEARSLEALVERLVQTGDLPEGYRLAGDVTEFAAGREGYRISARADGAVLSIRPPERLVPFWALLF